MALPSQFKFVLHINFSVEHIGYATPVFIFLVDFYCRRTDISFSALDIRFFILCMDFLSHVNWLSQVEVV